MSVVPAKLPRTLPGSSARPAKRGRPILSIRARLIVLALVAVAPLMIERVHRLETTRAEVGARAHAEAAALARQGAEAQRQVIDSLHPLLQVFARIYMRTPLDPAACKAILADFEGNVPWLRGLNVATPDGRINCATDPRAIGLNVSDRRYFQTALHERDFALSDYLISRVHHAPGLIATFPILANDGTPKGVILASINLHWMGELVARAARHSGAAVFLIDGSGTLIAASADEAQLIGKNFAANALVRNMLAADDGAATTAGFDGVRRIFAFIRVPWTRARLAVGLDEYSVHSGIDHEISVAYLQLAVFGTLVLLAAWFGGEQLIVQPIRSLVRTAARFGRGDLYARASEERWPVEFVPLAEAFDDMARRLAAREEELRIANHHLDELASLDGLTGLANRRGFDRRLDNEWRRASERGGPVALMMIDIDHFKLFNDRYGHVAGDACLRAVSETLSVVTLNAAVLVARYGGEEFALLLPMVDSTGGVALAERARRAVEELLMPHAKAPRGYVTVSIGVAALVPEKHQSAADLVEAADRALYAAKRRGRNMVVAHTPALMSVAC